MLFDIPLSGDGNSTLSVEVKPGEILFVVGANGSGKSALMQLIATSAGPGHFKRISAHRANLFYGENAALSLEQKRQNEAAMANNDITPDSRWKDEQSAQRPMVSLFNLVEDVNARSRQIANAVDSANEGEAKSLARATPDTLGILNRLLTMANLPITLAIGNDSQVVAKRPGYEPYSVTRLSDGERNATLLACDVLTAKQGQLVLLDEPEKHLHRSIAGPLLVGLVRQRPDLAFVISTHDVSLPGLVPESATLILRSCEFFNGNSVRWKCDFAPGGSVPDEIRADVLGARQHLLFVEGSTDGSLDQGLYQRVFPGLSVIAKNSCGEVEKSVLGVGNSHDLHWLKAWGLTDGDSNPSDVLAKREVNQVYALKVYSIESIYYHPTVQRHVLTWTRRSSSKAASAVDNDPTREDSQASEIEASLGKAITSVLSSFKSHADEVASYVVTRAVSEAVRRSAPGRQAVRRGEPVSLAIDVASLMRSEVEKVNSYIQGGDDEHLIAHYPIRVTGALQKIASALGFATRDAYEAAVLEMLDSKEGAGAMSKIKDLVGPLASIAH